MGHFTVSLLLVLLQVSGSAAFSALQCPVLGGPLDGRGLVRTTRHHDLHAQAFLRQRPRGVLESRMGAWEVVNAFPWALIPGTVAAAVLVREGGFSSIGVFIDETFDYLEEKGGYIITGSSAKSKGVFVCSMLGRILAIDGMCWGAEEQLKGSAGEGSSGPNKLNVESIQDAFDR